jgi:predicted ATPase
VVFSAPERRPDPPTDDAPALGAVGAAPPPVPAALSGFVGRARDLAEVRGLLGRARLVTLAGPGGAGKTRLARELAAQAAEGAAAFPDGAWWLELAPLPPGADPAPAAAAALGVRQSPGADPSGALADTLAAALAGRRLLLVLDNCEHVVDGAAALAEHLLRGCPGLSVLATSREALGVEGEVVWPVAGLAHPPVAPTVPDRGDGQAGTGAPGTGAPARRHSRRPRRVRGGRALRRARPAVQPTFALTARTGSRVAAITARLDGLPLALELAAAQVATLGVEQLACGWTTCSPCSRGAPGRAAAAPHAARAARLELPPAAPPPERALLAQLSVFRGTFTLEQAEAVCAAADTSRDDPGSGALGTGGAPAPRVVAALGRLVEQSLVEVREQEGEARYRLLEPVRQYAAARLAGTPEEARTRDRHLRWAAALVAAAAPALGEHGRAAVMRLLRQQLEDLRAPCGGRRRHPAKRAPRRARARRSRSWPASRTSG